MSTVFVHIGLAKTGTTSVQSALHQRREAAAAAGLHVPGSRHRAHRLAAYDLLGRRVEGDDVDVVAGSFRRLVEDIDAAGRPRAVFSEELLAAATPRQVRRLVRALDPHHVEVVVGLRDLGRTLVSAWQQEVVMGGTVSWQEFAADVRDAYDTGARAGVAFWLRQDVARILDVWQRHVPADRIHLVTVPPAGADSRLLLERFEQALRLPAGTLAHEASPANVSLGPAELEALRRLNRRVTGSLDERRYLQLVEHGIRERLHAPASRPLLLPDQDRGWVAGRSRELLEGLSTRGHVVHGDLADLVVEPTRTGGGRRLDDVTDRELLTAHEEMLAALALSHGALLRRHRRLLRRSETRPGVLEQARSGGRALVFASKVAALSRADRSRLFRWAARQYLSRGAGRRSSLR